MQEAQVGTIQFLKAGEDASKIVRGQWEPLISTETFEQGLAILDRRNRKPNNHYKHVYLLKGLIELQNANGSRSV